MSSIMQHCVQFWRRVDGLYSDHIYYVLQQSDKLIQYNRIRLANVSIFITQTKHLFCLQVIPYLGMYLTDLTLIHHGSRDFLDDDIPPDGQELDKSLRVSKTRFQSNRIYG